MSKGSTQRPRSVSLEEFKDNWERIFGPCTFSEDGDREASGHGGVSDDEREVHGSRVQDSQVDRVSTRDNDG